MVALQERYLTDHEGKRVGVVLDMERFQHILEDLEELDDIRAFDAAQTSGDDGVPFDRAIAEIGQNSLGDAKPRVM